MQQLETEVRTAMDADPRTLLLGAWIAGVIMLGAAQCPLLAHSPHDDVSILEVSPDYAHDATVFIRISYNNEYFLKSSNRGATFLPCQGGRSSSPVTTLALSPAYGEDRTALHGALDGAYLSNDGGARWRSCFSEDGVETIHVTSAQGGRMGPIYLVSRNKGVFVSRDGGTTWLPFEIVGLPASSKVRAITSVDDQVFFCSAYGHLLVFSMSTGQWRTLPNLSGRVGHGAPNLYASGKPSKRFPPIAAIIVSPDFAQDHLLIAATMGWGILTSRDGGKSWTASNHGMDARWITDVVFSPDYRHDRTLALCTRDGDAYMSFDQARSWRKRSNGLERNSPQHPIHGRKIRFSPNYAVDGTLYIAKHEGVYRTTDRGGFWRHLTALNLRKVRYAKISPDFARDRTMYITNYTGNVYRSRDGGQSWEASNTGLPLNKIDGFQLSPTFASDGVIYVAAHHHLWKSVNAGRTWVYAMNLRPVRTEKIHIRYLAVSPDFEHDGEMLFTNPKGPLEPGMSYSDRRLFRYSAKDNITEKVCVNPDNTPVAAISYIPQYSRRKVLFAGGNGVYKSEDGGATWRASGLKDLPIKAIDVSDNYLVDGRVFAVAHRRRRERGSGYGRIYVSMDAGASWTRLTGELEDKEVEYMGVSPNFSKDRTLFAATYGHGLWKSMDGGGRWVCVGFRDNLIRNIVLSPSYERDQTLVVCAFNGLYLSTDGGASWRQTWHLDRNEEKRLAYSFRDAEGRSQAWKKSPHGFAEGSGWRYVNDPTASSGRYIVTSKPGNQVEFFFHGHAVRYLAMKNEKMGIVHLSLDGEEIGEIDLYHPRALAQQLVFSRDALPQGEHLLRLQCTGRKHDEAEAAAMSIDAFDVEF